MSSKINLQTCEYARKSSIFQDNQLISFKSSIFFKNTSLAFLSKEEVGSSKIITSFLNKKTKYFVFSQFIKFFYKLRTRRTIIFFKNYIEIILIIYFFLMLLLICTFVYLSYSILLFTILFDYCWDNQFLYYFIIC